MLTRLSTTRSRLCSHLVLFGITCISPIYGYSNFRSGDSTTLVILLLLSIAVDIGFGFGLLAVPNYPCSALLLWLSTRQSRLSHPHPCISIYTGSQLQPPSQVQQPLRYF